MQGRISFGRSRFRQKHDVPFLLFRFEWTDSCAAASSFSTFVIEQQLASDLQQIGLTLFLTLFHKCSCPLG